MWGAKAPKESACPSHTYQSLTSPVLYQEIRPHTALRSHQSVMRAPGVWELKAASKPAQCRLFLHHTEEITASGLTFTSWRYLNFLPAFRVEERQWEKQTSQYQNCKSCTLWTHKSSPVGKTSEWKEPGTWNLTDNGSTHYPVVQAWECYLLPLILSFFIGKWR